MRLLTYILLIAMSAMMIAACSQRHESISAFERIDPRGWPYGDTIRIPAQGLDSAMTRQLAIAVRHTNDYPYRNLWLEVTYHTGASTIRDTLQLELADIYGRWLGSGFGPSYQMEKTLKTSAIIADSTIIGIRHIMRTDTLRGIELVGIDIRSNH